MKTNRAIVVVHPTWPWESRADIPVPLRFRFLERSGLLLSRIADHLDTVRESNRFLIGPFVNRASFLPNVVCVDILRVEKAVSASSTHGEDYSLDSLDSAALKIASKITKLPQVTEVFVIGFYRNAYCLHASERLSEYCLRQNSASRRTCLKRHSMPNREIHLELRDKNPPLLFSTPSQKNEPRV